MADRDEMLGMALNLMDRALELLDAAHEGRPALYLQHAIEVARRQPAPTTGQEPIAGDTAYYARHAQQHLDLAKEVTTTEARIVHLDLASHYATLRELTERAAAKG